MLLRRLRSLWVVLRRVVRLAVILVASGAALFVADAAAEILAFAQKDETRRADAAIVLGAGLIGGDLSPVFRERVNHAVALYEAGTVDVLLLTGGQGQSVRQSEARAARRYALARGVPEEAILLEETSRNTVENLANAQAIAAGRGLETFLIVSTPFHMKRAVSIAGDLGMEAYSSPTRTTEWISWFTKTRAFLQEVVSYTVYLVSPSPAPVD
jgi:uncharacterized SAM-binding protein YcdF (DUF218 family)